MKTRTGIIILIVVLIFYVALVIVAGVQNSNFNTTTTNTTTTKITTTVSTKKVTTTKVTISASTREDLAETKVLSKALIAMRTSSLFKEYDVDSTRYKIGKVEKKGDTFTFYITFYLYDYYGNYKDKLQKSISVDVDEYGEIGYLKVTFYKSDFN